MKFNTNGNLQWTQNAFGTLESSRIKSIKVDNDGNVFVTGVMAINMQLQSSIQQVQSNGFNFMAGGGTAYAIALDNAGNAYVTGNDHINIRQMELMLQQ